MRQLWVNEKQQINVELHRLIDSWYTCKYVFSKKYYILVRDDVVIMTTEMTTCIEFCLISIAFSVWAFGEVWFVRFSGYARYPGFYRFARFAIRWLTRAFSFTCHTNTSIKVK